MAKIDAIREKIQKLGRKQKLKDLIKYLEYNDDEVRLEVAIALGQIKTYESGMALISLLRDPSPMVRAAAATSAADIDAKHCEEYVKKLAFADNDPNVRNIAKQAFDRLKTSVL